MMHRLVFAAASSVAAVYGNTYEPHGSFAPWETLPDNVLHHIASGLLDQDARLTLGATSKVLRGVARATVVTLDLSHSEVEDLNPLLAAYSRVRELRLAGTLVRSLAPLAHLTHLEYLDISDCPFITDLTPLLQFQHSLHTLILTSGRMTVTPSSAHHVDFGRTPLSAEGLEVIRQMHALTDLRIPRFFPDLTRLVDLVNLKVLWINRNSGPDCLETGLPVNEVHDTAYRNLADALQNMRHMRELRLVDVHLTAGDFLALGELRGTLRALSLYMSNSEEEIQQLAETQEILDGLGALADLEEFWADGFPNALATQLVMRMPNLRILGIADCGTLSFLSELTNLEELHIGIEHGQNNGAILDADISAFTPEVLPRLRSLNVTSFNGHSFGFHPTFPEILTQRISTFGLQLQSLTLQVRPGLRSLEFLASLTNLRYLNLRVFTLAERVSLDPIGQNLVNLETLEIGDIADISALSTGEFDKLKHLRVSLRAISATLRNFPSLETVNLSLGRRFEGRQLLLDGAHPKLRSLSLHGNGHAHNLTKIVSPETLANIRELFLRNSSDEQLPVNMSHLRKLTLKETLVREIPAVAFPKLRSLDIRGNAPILDLSVADRPSFKLLN